MNDSLNNQKTEFDAYAADYDAALHRGVSLSGERKEYFAEARIAWLKRRLGAGAEKLGTVMDFGCGTGSGVPFLHAQLRPREILGVDISSASLEIARSEHAALPAHFLHVSEDAPVSSVNLVFSNGTFHHIPPAERPGALEYLQRALMPGGVLAIWENNPWNPGTRMVMARIPFDRDAMPVSAPVLARLVRAAGFEVLAVDFCFVFPKVLRGLRFMEPWIVKLPLGAQYLVLARKSSR